MKKIILSLLVLTISTSSLIAQISLRLNTLGLIKADAGIGIDYNINDEISVGLFTNYIIGNPYLGIKGINNLDNYSYRAYKISPEFRYYVTRDLEAVRGFYGAYLRYSSEEYTELVHNSPYYKPYGYKNTSIILGLTVGSKRVYDSGFFVENLIGVGRCLSTSPTFSSTEAEDYIHTNYDGLDDYIYYRKWDIRFHFSVGYMFGTY